MSLAKAGGGGQFEIRRVDPRQSLAPFQIRVLAGRKKLGKYIAKLNDSACILFLRQLSRFPPGFCETLPQAAPKRTILESDGDPVLR
jgi:hypothetical protein